MPVNVISADRLRFDDNGNRYVAPTVTLNKNGFWVGPYGWRCRAQQREVRLDLVKPGEAIAIDCEGVILDDEVGIRKKGVGRFSVVNEKGQIIYDTFVYYPDDVAHRPPPQWLDLGVKYKDIMPANGAQPLAEVLKIAERIFDKAGVIVGHAVHNDMDMLRGVPWHKYHNKIRDTQQLPEYRALARGRDGNVALAILSDRVLNHQIQQDGHSSVDDADATGKLYARRKDAIEAMYANTGLFPTPSWSGSPLDANAWWEAPASGWEALTSDDEVQTSLSGGASSTESAATSASTNTSQSTPGETTPVISWAQVAASKGAPASSSLTHGGTLDLRNSDDTEKKPAGRRAARKT